MPDDPRDVAPEDAPPPVPGTTHPLLPPSDDTPAVPGPDRPRGGSIFNRFRRGRQALDDLQARFALSDSAPAATDDDPSPGLARSPWQRFTSEGTWSAPLTSAPQPPASSPSSPETAQTSVDGEPPASAALPAPSAWSATVEATPRPEALPAAADSIDIDAEAETEIDHTAASKPWMVSRLIPVPLNAYVPLLAGLATVLTLAYLLVEPSPRWFLIMGAAAVAGGLDGTLRATWRSAYIDRDTTPALFMPAIFILAVPPLIEHNMRGLAVIPAGLAAGFVFFLIVAGQVGSVRPGASYYPWARTVSTAGAYAAAFAFFSLTYVYDLGLVVSAAATGLVALMLAIEILREGEIDATETAGYAAAAGAVVGQWRLALHYLPVDGYLAALAVLLGFLLVTGLLQAYITRSLDRRATVDHAVIAVAGAALVVGARVMGLA